MPPAARISDMHTCPMVNPGPVPHVGGPDISGSPNVITGYMPQARMSDSLVCVPAIDKIAAGSPTVLVNNLQAARLGDPTVHGGKIVAGCPTVIIGESGQGATLRGASASGVPFCEECEKARKKAQEEALAEPPPNQPPADSANTLTAKGKALLAELKHKFDEILPPEKRKELQKLVKVIKPVAQLMLDKGKDEKSVADWALAARKSLGELYEKKFDNYGDMAVFFYDRNKDKFGDALGPGVEWLMSEKGKTYRDIIEKAATGDPKGALEDLKGDIVGQLAEKVTDNPEYQQIIKDAAFGKWDDVKQGVAGQLVGNFTDNEAIKDIAKAAVVQDWSTVKQGLAEQLVGNFTDNQAIKDIAKSAVIEDWNAVKQGAAEQLISQFTDNEAIKGIAKAAAIEDWATVKGGIAEQLAGVVSDNPAVKEMAKAAALGNWDEVKTGMVEQLAQKMGANETITSLAKAAAQGQLAGKLTELSGQTVDKFFANLGGGEDVQNVLKPVADYLKAKVTEAVAKEAAKLLGGGA